MPLPTVDSFVKTLVMSNTKNCNDDLNIVLHIGPHFELNEVKQMKNTNNVDINCCKSSSCKVGVTMEKKYFNQSNL